MKYVVMGVAFALVAGTPASGQQNGAPAPGVTNEQVAVQKKPDSKRVCRRVETTGSIMRQTVCKTQDQWTAEEQASRDDVERIQNSRRGGSQSQ